MPGNFQAVFIVQNYAPSGKLEESILETCWLAQKYNVNTLSAKADSFLEHPAQRRGYAQLARSRPCAIKDINRRVVVPGPTPDRSRTGERERVSP
jgi:hypothetical protein